MIAGVHKGSDFAGIFGYLLFKGKGANPEPRGQILLGPAGADTAEELIAHFQGLQRLRPDVANPVHHVHVSLAPGETLTILQWLAIAEAIAETMRWGVGHLAVIGHGETHCQHIHIVGTPLSEGRVYPEQFRDHRLVMKCLRRFEVEFGLRRVPSPTSPRNRYGRVPQPERRSNRERQMAQRKPSQKDLLRQAIDEVIAAGYRKGAVLLEMKRRGYEPFVVFRGSVPVGVSWRDLKTNRKCSGARLGTAYSGVNFFNRIGGLHGEASGLDSFNPDRVPTYDAAWRWENVILRRIDQGHRSVAGSFLR